LGLLATGGPGSRWVLCWDDRHAGTIIVSTRPDRPPPARSERAASRRRVIRAVDAPRPARSEGGAGSLWYDTRGHTRSTSQGADTGSGVGVGAGVTSGVGVGDTSRRWALSCRP